MNETLLKKLAKPMLVCAPLIWGSTFFMIKDALDDIDGMFMLAFRFSGGGGRIWIWPICGRARFWGC